MVEKRKICIATSTRADWGLLSPLAHALRARADVELHLLVTNMHLLESYGHTVDAIVAEGFTDNYCIYMPDTDDCPDQKVKAMAKCMEGTAEALHILSPDMLIILGDRYEMLAVASAAEVMKVPIVHLHGGEISEGAIDDSIRHAISKLASLHLTATEEYRDRVIQMGESPDRVVNTGAIGVWNITHMPLMTIEELSESLSFALEDGKTLVVTFHPATLDGADAGWQCQQLLEALDHFPEYKVVISYPNNDAGSEQIIDHIVSYAAEQPQRVLLVKSLGLSRYLSLLSHSAAAVGNSSSGIIEVPSMGIPTVDVGIRQQGRLAADSVIHCGNTADEIVAAITKALSPVMQQIAAQRRNPYAKDNTVDLMVDAIMTADPKELIYKRFYDK